MEGGEVVSKNLTYPPWNLKVGTILPRSEDNIALPVVIEEHQSIH